MDSMNSGKEDARSSGFKFYSIFFTSLLSDHLIYSDNCNNSNHCNHGNRGMETVVTMLTVTMPGLS